MKELAPVKVIAGFTSEMEVAAVLGLVESRRQYSNQMFGTASGSADPLPSVPENTGQPDEIIEGKFIG